MKCHTKEPRPATTRGRSRPGPAGWPTHSGAGPALWPAAPHPVHTPALHGPHHPAHRWLPARPEQCLPPAPPDDDRPRAPALRPGHQALWAPTWLRAGPAAGGCSLPSVLGCCARPGPTPYAAGRTGGSSWALALNGNTGDDQGAVPAVDAGTPPPEPAGSAVTQPPWVLGLLGCCSFLHPAVHTRPNLQKHRTPWKEDPGVWSSLPWETGDTQGLTLYCMILLCLLVSRACINY